MLLLEHQDFVPLLLAIESTCPRALLQLRLELGYSAVGLVPLQVGLVPLQAVAWFVAHRPARTFVPLGAPRPAIAPSAASVPP